jgi:hypothetical protein
LIEDGPESLAEYRMVIAQCYLEQAFSFRGMIVPCTKPLFRAAFARAFL